jgi:hypothetical protein
MAPEIDLLRKAAAALQTLPALSVAVLKFAKAVWKLRPDAVEVNGHQLVGRPDWIMHGWVDLAAANATSIAADACTGIFIETEACTAR